MRHIRIGTRGSPLALIQAKMVQDMLYQAYPYLVNITICPMVTSGDRIQDRVLAEWGGKGLFTKEIEEALIQKEVDLAVHSMKDVAYLLPIGLKIGCILPRGDPRDAFVSHNYATISDLPLGACIGTSSLRRAGQVRMKRPDLRIVPFRGNVETRIRKLQEGQADATFLAVAGLMRLKKENHIRSIIDTNTMLPSAGQATIGVEIREEDTEMERLLAPLSHAESAFATQVERALLAKMEAGCKMPFAAHASIHDEGWVIEGWKGSDQSDTSIRSMRRFSMDDYEEATGSLAEELQK